MPMGYQVLLDAERQLLDVRYQGAVSLQERRRALAEALGLANGAGIVRFLIDFSQGSATPYDGFERGNAFAMQLACEPRLRRSRIAYVAPRAGQINPVVEVLAGARRVPFQRFPDRTDAIDWLMQFCAAPPPSPHPAPPTCPTP